MLTPTNWCRHPQEGDIRLKLQDYQIQSGRCVITHPPSWLADVLHESLPMDTIGHLAPKGCIPSPLHL